MAHGEIGGEWAGAREKLIPTWTSNTSSVSNVLLSNRTPATYANLGDAGK